MITEPEHDLAPAESGPLLAQPVAPSLRTGLESTGSHATGQWSGLRSFSPLHVIAALGSTLAIWSAAGSLTDIDLFWHIQLGQQISRLHRVTGLPSWWLAVPEPHGWLTSQWLSELSMYGITQLGGFRGLMFVTLVLMLLLLIGLAVALLRHRPAAVAVPVFLLTLAGTSMAIQQRPQSVSLVLLPWLGLACSRLLTGQGKPPLAVVAGVSLIWAQFHGLWILGPVAFAVAAAGIVLDQPRPLRNGFTTARPALLCLVASFTGVLNPHGLGSFVLPFQFRSSTSFITEWWPTTFTMSFTACWGALLLITFVAWGRSARPIPRSEILWVLAWTVFGLQSYRNVSPALLLIAPVTITALMRLFGDRLEARPRPTGLREAQVLAAFCAVVLCGGLLLGADRASTADPIAKTPAAALAAWVSRQPGPIRIFNTYNSSGALVGLSGGKARLVIDGRADLWGARYAKSLSNAEEMKPGWEATVTRLHVQAVVIEKSAALMSGLQSNGWRVVLTDQDFALLIPTPGARFT